MEIYKINPTIILHSSEVQPYPAREGGRGFKDIWPNISSHNFKKKNCSVVEAGSIWKLTDLLKEILSVSQTYETISAAEKLIYSNLNNVELIFPNYRK